MERSQRVSTTNGQDPIDRLHAADPVRADEVPSASLARVSASVQEHIVSDSSFNPTTRRSRGPLAAIGGVVLAGALVFAVAVSSGFGLGTQSPGPIGSAPTPSEDPAAGGGLASCLVYDPANLPTFEIVFDGTVSAIDGDQVTFAVNEDWKGAGERITLTAPAVNTTLVGPLPDFEVDGRYLVTAFDSTINACGYTIDYDADTAADWAAAFAA
jgi:hypothetical protein